MFRIQKYTKVKIGKISLEINILAEQQQTILLNQEKILEILLGKPSSLPQELEQIQKMLPLKNEKDLEDLYCMISDDDKMKQLVRLSIVSLFQVT